MIVAKVKGIYDEEKELRFFLDGYKPAIIPMNKSSIIYKTLIKSDYMYCKSTWLNMPIFFQNITECYSYMQALYTNITLGPDSEYVTSPQTINGLTLGYHPNSVIVFEDSWDCVENTGFINFYGLYFAIDIDQLEEIISALFIKYKIPADYDGEILVQSVNTGRIEKIDPRVSYHVKG